MSNLMAEMELLILQNDLIYDMTWINVKQTFFHAIKILEYAMIVVA